VTQKDELTLENLISKTSEAFPVLANSIRSIPQVLTEKEYEAAKTATEFVRLKLSAQNLDLDVLLDAFAEVSIDFMRLQARFYQTGHYARKSAEGLVEELYENSEAMGGHYLAGLMMTYALWPNHSRTLSCLINDFMPNLALDSSIAEIGVGHGLMSWKILQESERTYRGFDISSKSIEYCRSGLKSIGIDNEISFVLGDVTDVKALSENDQVDHVLCCEVLEHVDNPELLVRAIRSLLKEGGTAFVTTVCNLEAEDHVFLFNNPDEIRALFISEGLKLVEDWEFIVSGSTNDLIVPINYAAIVKR
jgi:2-polyprenyl-3-methyl-5-hydroxy-6-metoxy-1,4-benzoquinol methylase